MDSPLPVEPYGDAAVRQRARAEARASFARVGARTEPERLFETGGLRWRFPRSSSPCEAAIVNTGGGVAGGDSYSVSLTLSEGAEVEATTPSAERIYRSDGPAAAITTRLVLKPRARLFWLPQETLMFEGARLERRLELDTSGEAEFLVAETLVFGRLAMGETRIDATCERLMARTPRRPARVRRRDKDGPCRRDSRAQGGRGGRPGSVDDRRLVAQYRGSPARFAGSARSRRPGRRERRERLRRTDCRSPSRRVVRPIAHERLSRPLSRWADASHGCGPEKGAKFAGLLK